MLRPKILSSPRRWVIAGAVAALVVGGGIAQAALRGGATPPPKPLDRAVYGALHAPSVAGITARISFTNGLLPSGSLPEGSSSPVLAGADGRLWLTRDGRFRLELQSDSGDAQVVSDGHRVSVYDPSSNTVYRAALPPERHERGAAAAHRPPTLAGIDRALRDLARTWNVSGARPTSTAGQPSYTVRIAPRDDGGLLGAAELAWDAAKGVPLRAAVYAQGDSRPVLELKATDISYGLVPASDVAVRPPADAKVVDLAPTRPAGPHGRATEVRGVRAVARHVDFGLAAPAKLAGLPRREVRLVRLGRQTGALSVYGQGFGAIAVLQHRADARAQRPLGNLRLPQVNIGGATGTEVGTPLGTLVSFRRGGVDYVVAGSVPPLAAENAARGLR